MAVNGMGEPVTCNYPPVQINIWLKTPLALYGWPWISFDGLIAHIMGRARGPDRFRLLPSDKILSLQEVTGDELPLDRAGPVYRASISIFDTDTRSLHVIYKRFPTGYLDLSKIRKKRIDTARGEYRSWRINLVIVPTMKVTFYARGDPVRLKQYMKSIGTIGHKRVAGYGTIKKVEVEEIDVDMSLVDSQGRAMRPLPVSMLDEYYGNVYVGTYRPPYWDRRNTTLLVAPGTRVKLKRRYTCRT